METIVETIKQSYRDRQSLDEDSHWPPISSKEKLIKLQLVETEKEEDFRANLEQFGKKSLKPNKKEENSQQTSERDKKSKRFPILYNNIFMSKNQKKVRKILVEGNAGMGKTTLCTMLAEGWAEGKMLREFKCVILLPLRQESVSSANSLDELLHLLHDEDDDIHTTTMNELKKRRGDGVLIIADGWDELNDEKRLKTSFFYKLLFGSKPLKSASVLLTSRPSASNLLHKLNHVDRLIEVVGFNEENIQQYIESEFKEYPETSFSLIEQIESNPLIQSLCSVPLNCAIVCFLWDTLKQVLPNTLTELYAKIILCVVLRDIQKNLSGDSIEALDNFDFIPEDLQQTFWLICKFAYEYTSKDKIVFSESELSSIFPEAIKLRKNVSCFGLLQSARSILSSGQGLSFHFAHLTIQEFLAALHLVTLPNEEKTVVLNTHARRDRFSIVWRFVLGLGSNKEQAHKYSKTLIPLNDALVDHLKYAICDDDMLLAHCALESKDDVISQKIAGMINGQLSVSDNPHDYVAVLHVLNHTLSSSNLNLNLSKCGIGPKQLNQLANTLVSSRSRLQVKSLYIDNSKLTDESVTYLLRRAANSFQYVETLSFEDAGISCWVPSTPLKHLTDLDVSNNPLGVSGIHSIQKAILSDNLSNLEELNLSKTLTEDSETNGTLLSTLIPSIISHCLLLNELDLSKNILALHGACVLGEYFVPLTTKRREFKLDLSDTSIGTEAMVLFSKTVTEMLKSSAPSLVTISSECDLILQNNPFGHDGLKAISRLLRSKLFPVTNLNIDKTDTSSDHLLHSSHQLQCSGPGEEDKVESSSLTKLRMCNNKLGGHIYLDFMVTTATEYLFANLEELYLTNILIEDNSKIGEILKLLFFFFFFFFFIIILQNAWIH